MPPVENILRIFFIENTKSHFKNRKKIFNTREGPLTNRLSVFTFFHVKSPVTQPMGFKPKTSPSRVTSSTTPPITDICLY